MLTRNICQRHLQSCVYFHTRMCFIETIFFLVFADEECMRNRMWRVKWVELLHSFYWTWKSDPTYLLSPEIHSSLLLSSTRSKFIFTNRISPNNVIISSFTNFTFFGLPYIIPLQKDINTKNLSLQTRRTQPTTTPHSTISTLLQTRSPNFS